jgi:hypothetical protein
VSVAEWTAAAETGGEKGRSRWCDVYMNKGPKKERGGAFAKSQLISERRHGQVGKHVPTNTLLENQVTIVNQVTTQAHTH